MCNYWYVSQNNYYRLTYLAGGSGTGWDKTVDTNTTLMVDTKYSDYVVTYVSRSASASRSLRQHGRDDPFDGDQPDRVRVRAVGWPHRQGVVQGRGRQRREAGPRSRTTTSA